MAKTVSESFTHADTATGITADQPWSTDLGTPKIVGNKATGTGTTTHQARCDTVMDSDDYAIEFDVSGSLVSGAQYGVLARCQDGNNAYWPQAKVVGSGYYIFRVIYGGASVLVGPSSRQYATGDRVRFECYGSRLTLLVKSLADTAFTQVLQVTDLTFLTGKRFGLRMNTQNSSASIDAITVTASTASCVNRSVTCSVFNSSTYCRIRAF